MSPFDVAWNLLKALPEHQQYTNLPGLGESFGQPAPQHRVGTVHPAIRGMLNRLQNPDEYYDAWSGQMRPNPYPRNPEKHSLRTTGTTDNRGGNPEFPNMIVAHPGRSGMPSAREHEVYGDDYGQSPQFLDTDIQGVYDAGQVDAHAALRAALREGDRERGDEVRQFGGEDGTGPMVAGPHRIIQTEAPPKGSQQAMIDEIYAQRPSIAERAFR